MGDPACDVMVAWKVLTADTRDIFRAELSVDYATWARACGWALSQAMIALSSYTLETNPVLVRAAQQWMPEVLTDTGSTVRQVLRDRRVVMDLGAVAHIGKPFLLWAARLPV